METLVRRISPPTVQPAQPCERGRFLLESWQAADWKLRVHRPRWLTAEAVAQMAANWERHKGACEVCGA